MKFGTKWPCPKTLVWCKWLDGFWSFWRGLVGGGGVLDGFKDVGLVDDGFVGCLEPDDLDDDDDLRRGLCFGGGLWVVLLMSRMVVDTSLG